MPYKASRRGFLTGASIGLIAAAKAGALDSGGSGPEGGIPIWDDSLQPTERLHKATIVGVAGGGLQVEIEDSGLWYRLNDRDFGDWEHEIGDRVVVVEDSSGQRSVQPFVTTVNAPLPSRPREVEIGSVIEVGDLSARITNARVREAYRAIRSRSRRTSVHWLLIENVPTGEHRIFGVIDR